MAARSDEAQLAALDAKCASRTSSDSRQNVRLLSSQPLAYKKAYLHNCIFYDCANLVRCVLEVRSSASGRSSELTFSAPSRATPRRWSRWREREHLS